MSARSVAGVDPDSVAGVDADSVAGVDPSTLGSDPFTYAASVAYTDAAGNPGTTLSYGEFFTVLDATQFAIVQAWVFALTRERERVAVTIVRGGPVDPGMQVLYVAGSPHEITDAVGELLARQAGTQ